MYCVDCFTSFKWNQLYINSYSVKGVPNIVNFNTMQNATISFKGMWKLALQHFASLKMFRSKANKLVLY